MPCCLIAAASFFPRIALFIMWLVGYGGRAFETAIWPVLGFLFMPYTTCFYAIGMNERGGIEGWALLLLIIGVIFDMGSHGGTARSRTYYRTVRVERR